MVPPNPCAEIRLKFTPCDERKVIPLAACLDEYS